MGVAGAFFAFPVCLLLGDVVTVLRHIKLSSELVKPFASYFLFPVQVLFKDCALKPSSWDAWGGMRERERVCAYVYRHVWCFSKVDNGASGLEFRWRWGEGDRPLALTRCDHASGEFGRHAAARQQTRKRGKLSYVLLTWSVV